MFFLALDRREWWVNRLHRRTGDPATISGDRREWWANGREEWWIDGALLSIRSPLIWPREG